ncbi:Predicted membrane protein (DUF2214) [Seminavis robusta]|uniref:Predicted membrane protein (DUF2214) n=1 Tax=Seminavis robusta TaxID=568900 RepID=A0A9N8HT25_9STRA|nr:Predicted membrane protein (DUF2214) [Seminavis robusta]|eukprot:Sro1602_g285250.1 Predicted membrane protein (DUF2214) (264) ;mRNA; f:22138-23055
MMGMKRLVLTLLLSSWLHQGGYGFQPLHPQRQSRNLQVALAALRVPQNPLTSSNNKQGNPPENLLVEDRSDNEEAPSLNTAAGGLITERFLIKKNMSQEDEIKINNADGIYGLSAFSLLISGYFRVTEFAKGWDFYQHEPIFWLKMSSVAVLGGLSFFPAIVFFKRDQARQQGQTLAPLSDALVERITTLINAEILALLTIPLFASLMARGVLYMDNFPWPLGVVLYVVSLGGAGYKYGKEAFEMIESEQALVPIGKEEEASS